MKIDKEVVAPTDWGAVEPEQVFAPSGPLARAFDRYEQRPAQVKLAQRFAATMRDGGRLLAEAPTGSGKSAAYLVAAAIEANPSHAKPRSTIVVTANIALQEQLMRKDLPVVAQAFPGLTYQLVKGVGNYLCLDALEDAHQEPLVDPDIREQWDHLLDWSKHEDCSGDLSDVPFELTPKLRQAFTTTSDDCMGSSCPYRDDCYALQARRDAKHANVVVTNYHLFFSDLVIKAADGDGVLPPYGNLVFDEGHKMANIARDFFGWRLTNTGVERMLALLAGSRRRGKKMQPIDAALQSRARTIVGRFFDDLAAYARSDDYQVRLRDVDPVTWKPFHNVLVEVSQAYGNAHMAMPLTTEQRLEVQSLSMRTIGAAERLRSAMELDDADDRVYFLETMHSGTALACKPIAVGEMLERHLFGNEDVHSVSVTSATLSAGGANGFQHVADEIGAGGAERFVGDNPFSYSNSAVVVPTGMPEPNTRGFARAVGAIMPDIIRRAGGRTLCLFTSWRVLNEAKMALEQAKLPFTLLVQGTAPRTELVRRFREDVTSVLLGVESMWQGVDVPGEALSCVIIDRLPFKSPDDPIVDAISSRDPNGWFKGYSLPEAVISFKQGFGRLIRTRDDRGVVVVLDKRITGRGYGKKFFRALPQGVRGSTKLEVIDEILGA